MWKLIGEKLGDKDEMDALSDPRPLSRPLEWQTHIKPDAQSNWVRPIQKLKIQHERYIQTSLAILSANHKNKRKRNEIIWEDFFFFLGGGVVIHKTCFILKIDLKSPPKKFKCSQNHPHFFFERGIS